MKIGIVGLGLIGGSFAKAYKKYSDAVVYGLDTDPAVTEFARIYGAVDDLLNDGNNRAYATALLIALISR